MDQTRFELIGENLPTGAVPTIHPYANGVPLRDLVRAAEQPFADADGIATASHESDRAVARCWSYLAGSLSLCVK
ncbi:hypothetical protein I6A84_26355 [Frankia sp. CNm7]|uniref:Uncharacterized protein n=1 Tax=Frankia nepalensis TaxID=1836974 RepID=A0A937UPA5_9ACTN|nr:hypothetical protein [Frankia nepalensis]MBL7498386.1 hypothetical protein [Frankia nepalensis]MBL7514158.1 hypothetical protein [Frankia nepalensis]MBL7521508.1 hypothetical protein [Frankia nepalensis]MBL7628888.1 hypothetical protein [Frankia nepalensis]